jgi:peptide/nickel transport system permease protein
MPLQPDRLSPWLALPRRIIVLAAAYGLALLLVLALRTSVPGVGLTPDWWRSTATGQPLAEFLTERAPASLALLGLAFAWAGLLALLWALGAALVEALRARSPAGGTLLAGLGRLVDYAIATLPVFVLAVIFFMASGPGAPAWVRQALLGLALALLPALLAAMAAVRAWRTAVRQPVLAGLLTGPASLAAQTGGLLSGLVLVETAAAVPGIGGAMLRGLVMFDMPVVVGSLLVFITLAFLGRLIAELFYWLARIVSQPLGGPVPAPAASAPPAPDAPVTPDTGPLPAAPPPAPPAGPLPRWRTSRAGLALGLVLLLIPIGLVAAGLATDEALALRSDLANRLAPPSAALPWGADELGRDLQARGLRGAVNSLGIPLVAAAAVLLPAALAGFAAGALARRGRWWSESLADLLLLPAEVLALMPAVPAGLLFVLLARQAQPGPGLLAAVLALLLLPRAVRAAQCLWLGARTQGMRAALGGLAALLLAGWFMAFWLGAALDFLGLGVAPPTPSLGLAFSTGFRFIFEAPHAAWVPAVLLWLCAVCLFTAADVVLGRFANKQAMVQLNL